MSGERFKHRKYLQWAKRQGGFCCICRANTGVDKPAEENHHFDWANRGMGMKGRDHFIARLCREHHSQLQGKGRRWFRENEQLEILTAMLEDALNMLSDFVLARKRPGGDVNQDDVF